MPYTDNEWGDWDESQYDVRSRPAWLENLLHKDKPEPLGNLIESSIKEERLLPKLPKLIHLLSKIFDVGIFGRERPDDMKDIYSKLKS